jgi:hypothetical protein
MVSTVIRDPTRSRLLSYWWNHLINPISVTIAPIAPVKVFCLLYGMGGFRDLKFTSLEYRVLRIANTYVGIMATAASRVNRRICAAMLRLE